MSYREPIARTPRLFYVSIAFKYKNGATSVASSWQWAMEGDDALDQAIEENRKFMRNEHPDDVWYWEVICAEDFVEREAKGPPPKAESK